MRESSHSFHSTYVGAHSTYICCYDYNYLASKTRRIFIFEIIADSKAVYK